MISVPIRPRGGAASLWAFRNPVLKDRELGVETDSLRAKIGDGVTAWNDLPYAFDEAGQVIAEQNRAGGIETELRSLILGVGSTLDDERVLARDASNLNSGLIPDARLSANITRDSEVTTIVAGELAAYQPGLEIASGEKTSPATSTQTVPNATGTIGGLTSGVIVGAGRPVDVHFECSLAWNATANKHSYASLMVNGGAGGSADATVSPSTSTGKGFKFTRRVVLTAGVNYTFTVALYTENPGGGQVTAFASVTYPMQLTVTNR